MEREPQDGKGQLEPKAHTPPLGGSPRPHGQSAPPHPTTPFFLSNTDGTRMHSLNKDLLESWWKKRELEHRLIYKSIS